jgi:hypothetical protein
MTETRTEQQQAEQRQGEQQQTEQRQADQPRTEQPRTDQSRTEQQQTEQRKPYRPSADQPQAERQQTQTQTEQRQPERRPDRMVKPAPAIAPGERNGARRDADGVGSPDRDTLLPEGERNKLTLALQRALGGFVDEPRNAVQEADRLLDETTTRLAEGIKERRGTLRSAWQGDGAKDSDTEEMRIALRQYRDLVQQLLRV